MLALHCRDEPKCHRHRCCDADYYIRACVPDSGRLADQLDTTPEDMAELATNMLCQFEELREFAAGLVAGARVGVGANAT